MSNHAVFDNKSKTRVVIPFIQSEDDELANREAQIDNDKQTLSWKQQMIATDGYLTRSQEDLMNYSDELSRYHNSPNCQTLIDKRAAKRALRAQQPS